jgi:ferritin-like protein
MNDSIVDKKLQDAVRKLISEEYFAYQLYLFSKMAVKKEDRCVLFDLFTTIATDELDDHMKTLIDWCVEYNVDVPCSEAEFKKCAATKVSRQVS